MCVCVSVCVVHTHRYRDSHKRRTTGTMADIAGWLYDQALDWEAGAVAGQPNLQVRCCTHTHTHTQTVFKTIPASRRYDSATVDVHRQKRGPTCVCVCVSQVEVEGRLFSLANNGAAHFGSAILRAAQTQVGMAACTHPRMCTCLA